MIWPIILVYALVIGRFVWVRAEQDNFGRLLFFAVACSLPMILAMVLLFSWGLSLVSGCEFYASARGRGPTCLLGSWDITDWMAAGAIAPIGMLFLLPVWTLFFAFLFAVGKVWDRLDRGKRKS